MTTEPTRRRLLAAGSVGLCGALAGCSGVTPFVGKRQTIDRTFEAPSGTLAVDTDSGRATVERTDGDEVTLHAVREAASVFADVEAASVDASVEDGRFAIAGRGTSDWLTGGTTVDLEVGVPNGVAVERVSGGNGDAMARDVAGDVAVSSSNGDAVARSVDGAVSVSTSNGDAVAREVPAIRGAESINGDVSVDVAGVVDRPLLTTVNGDVTARIDPALDLTVVATTRNGDVDVFDLPLSLEASGGGQLRGTLGDGGGDGDQLTLESTNGDLALRRLS